MDIVDLGAGGFQRADVGVDLVGERGGGEDLADVAGGGVAFDERGVVFGVEFGDFQAAYDVVFVAVEGDVGGLFVKQSLQLDLPVGKMGKFQAAFHFAGEAGRALWCGLGADEFEFAKLDAAAVAPYQLGFGVDV